MDLVKNKLLELEELCEKHPTKIPCEEVAKFLDLDVTCLRSALTRGNTPFGFGYQKKDGGNRAFVISTVTFYLWYTNTTAQMVLGHAVK